VEGAGHRNVRRKQIGVLISGRGSNLDAIIRAIAAGRLNASIAVVVTNNPEARGLTYAREAGIETVTLSHRGYARREAYDHALAHELHARDVDLVCLAGFMRLLGPGFCETFRDAVLNIHPSLLPAFAGVHAQAQAIEHGARITGATVHFVTPDLDAGPIVAQQAVPVEDGDTVDSLSARILAVEHELYPRTIHRVLHVPWRVVGRRVLFDEHAIGWGKL
jgi:phosphoribosylglycinamide formyltransferase-1